MSLYVDNAAVTVDAGGVNAFTAGQRNALVNHPGLLDAFRGNRIDVMARRGIINDPVLADLFDDGELQSFYTCGPDFRSAGGAWWDMTTPGQWLRHVLKYGPRGTLLSTK